MSVRLESPSESTTGKHSWAAKLSFGLIPICKGTRSEEGYQSLPVGQEYL